MNIPTFAVLMLSAALGACAVSSPAIQHFQLHAPNLQVQDRGGPSLYVDAITMPDYLLRSELLIRDDDYTLHYDTTRRWAEPLDLAIRRLIAQHLKSELGTLRVGAFPNPPRPDTQWRLSVDVRQFEAVGTAALLAAEGRWDSTTDAQDRSLVVSFSREIPLTDLQGNDIASALSQLISQFSRELADAVAAE